MRSALADIITLTGVGLAMLGVWLLGGLAWACLVGGLTCTAAGILVAKRWA